MEISEREKEIAKLDHDDLKQESSDRLKFQVEFAQSVIRSLVLANGGAMIALFTFIGRAESKQVLLFDTQSIWLSFMCFVVGLCIAIISLFAAFFSQLFYTRSATLQVWNKQEEMLGGDSPGHNYARPFKQGRLAEGLGIISVFASLAVFIAGSAFALSGVLPNQ